MRLSNASDDGQAMATHETAMRVASWNVAGVNNNPFEYWVSTEDPEYLPLMEGVQMFMTSPGNNIFLREIFTPAMFSDLCHEMDKVGLHSISEVTRFWIEDYSQRRVLSDFLLDKEMGMKRLSSMPDRITNAISLSDGSTIFRPSIISGYSLELISSLEDWWKQWRDFMFRTKVSTYSPDSCNAPEPETVYRLLSPIMRSKYPAITVEEQAISVQLQLLCLALLDAVFLYVVMSVSPDGKFRQVQSRLRKTLYNDKVPRTCHIISEGYGATEIFFIQEASVILAERLRQNLTLSEKYFLIYPSHSDGGRNQNSMILLNRGSFLESSWQDLTSQAESLLDGAFLAPGDLIAASVRDSTGREWLLASFHGDGNGLSTQPTIRAVARLARTCYPRHILMMGVDANTFSDAPGPLHHSVSSFLPFLREQGLVSLWGHSPDPSVRTTCSSRTFLQAQLTKATRVEDRSHASHQNLKDWILGFGSQGVSFCDAKLDNSGRRRFVQNQPLPTTEFPSDHAIVSCTFIIPSSTVPKLRAGRGQDISSLEHSFMNAMQGSMNIPHESSSKNALEPLNSNGSIESQCLSMQTSEKDREKHTLFDYWGINARTIRTQVSLDETVGKFRSWQNPANARTSVDFTPEEEIGDMCESLFVDRVRNPPDDNLDLKKFMMSRSCEGSVWILFSRRPVSLAMQKWWFHILFCALAMCIVFEAVVNILMVFSLSSGSGKYFRLQTTPSNASSEWNLVLLQDDCPLEFKSALTEDGGSRTLSFKDSVVFDGWYIEGLTAKADSFTAEATRVVASLDSVEWKEVPLPPWASMMGNTLVQRQTHGNNTQYFVDLTAPWEWIEVYCCLRLVLGVAMIASVCVARHGYARNAVLLSSIVFSLYGCWLVAYAIHAFSHNSWPYEVELNAWFGLLWLSFGITTYHERFQVDLLFFQAAVALSARAWKFSALGNVMVLAEVVDILFFIYSSILVSLSVWFLYLRAVTKYRIRNRLLQNDRLHFDSVWRELMSNGSESQSCSTLSNLVSQCSLTMSSNPLQRHGKARTGEDRRLRWTTSWFLWFLNPFTERPEITSLDQLFNQALCLDCFLKKKVLKLAHASGGYLLMNDESSPTETKLRKWCQLSDKEDSASRIVWAPLKVEDRALDKLFRCYNGRVSRLLDCCRQRIVFDTVGDVVHCLQEMLKDGEIDIVRIKNVLDKSNNAEETAGYRHLLVNFKIKSDGTSRLGVDTHICELQLALRCFAELVTRETHDKFLVFRSCRAENSLFGLISNLAPRRINREVSGLLSFNRARARVAHFPDGSVDSSRSRMDTRGQYPPPPVFDALGSVNCNSRQQALQMVFERVLRDVLSSPVNSRSGSVNKDRLIEEAVARAATGSIWDMSRPFAAALCKPWLPVLIAVAAVMLIIDLGVSLQLMLSDDFVEGRRFRFTNLESRVPGSEAGPGVSSFRVWLEGDCYVDDAGALSAVAVVNNSIVLSFAGGKRANRWLMVTASGPTDSDSVRFTVERSRSLNGSDWDVVSSSLPIWTWDGAVLWGDGRYSTPVARDWAVYFDMRRPLVWQVTSIAVTVWYIGVMLLLLAATVAKHQFRGRIITTVGLVVGHFILDWHAISCLLQQQGHMAVTALGLAVVQLGLGLELYYFERHMLPACELTGAMIVGFIVYHYLDLPQLPLSRGVEHIFSSTPFWLGAVVFVSSVASHITRVVGIIRSLRTIEQDKRAYDACWSLVEQHDAGRGLIAKLHNLCEHVQSELSPGVRQRVRAVHAGGKKGHSLRAESEEAHITADLMQSMEDSVGPPVEDLDQLMVQAKGLDLFLRDKVKEWALVCAGCFPVLEKGTRSFNRWDLIVGDVQKLEKVQWAKLKTSKRAIEKMYRSYDCDASRLLDCCRQSIYFEDLASLLAGFRCIAADPEAQIMRINNKLRHDYNSEKSAGYRDLMINLRIDTADTRRLFLDTHICEVQLVLIDFAHIKTQAGHARYVQWRNLRGR